MLLTNFTIRGVYLKASRKTRHRLIAILARSCFVSAAVFLVACAGPNSSPTITYSAETDIVDPTISYAASTSDARLDYREGWFQDGEHRIHFVEAGDGPLILLYHGFPSYWFSWHDQIEFLASDYRVIAVDGLGAGLSSKPEASEAYTVKALAAQLDRLAEALSPGERFVLIGHDWGAPLSFAYAQWRPDRLRGVIGMSAPPLNNLLAQLAASPEQQAISDYMQRFRAITLDAIQANGIAKTVAEQSYAKLAATGELSAREIELFHASVGRAEAVHGGMNWYRANIPPWDEIDDGSQWPSADARLEIPALFIWGEADGIFLPEIIDSLLVTETNLQIARLPGIGHWTPMEQPELANSAIRTFLGTLETTP